MNFTKRIALIVGLLTLVASALTLVGAMVMGDRVQNQLRLGSGLESRLSDKISAVTNRQMEVALRFERALWFGDGLADKERSKFLREAAANVEEAAKHAVSEIDDVIRFAQESGKSASAESEHKLWGVFASRLSAIKSEQSEYHQMLRAGLQQLQSGEVMEAQRQGVAAQKTQERIHEQLVQLAGEVSKVRLLFDSQLDTIELYGQAFAVVFAILGVAIAGALGLVLSRRATSGAQDAIDQLLHTAKLVTDTVTQLMSRAGANAAVVDNTASALKTVQVAVHAADDEARRTAAEIEASISASRSGERNLEKSIEALRIVRQQIEAMAVSVLKLRERSRPINDAMTAVGEVADEFRVFAVNAAIQANRGDTDGSSLTTVADEARVLAKQSSEMVDGLRKVLNEMQKAANVAVMVTEQGSRAVEAGVDQSIEAGEAIRTLVRTIADASSSDGDHGASQRHLQVVAQAIEAMDVLRDASAQGMDGMRRLEAGAQDIGMLSHRLRLLMGTPEGAGRTA